MPWADKRFDTRGCIIIDRQLSTIDYFTMSEAGEIRERLQESIDEAQLEWLKPFIQKEMAILVCEGLNLVEVGEAIAADNTTAVSRWISEQLISKPDSDRLANWNNSPDKRFNALIVQPYVLIQEI
jgi:hypothetical protein